MVRGWPQGDDGVTVSEPDRPAVGAHAPLFHPRNRGRCQVTEQVVRAERLSEGQPKRQGPRGRRGERRHTTAGLPTWPVRGPGPYLGRRLGEDLLDGAVERTNARKARSEGHIAHGQSSGFEQNSRGLGPLGSREPKRAGSNLRAELALDLADAVPELARQAGHALSINDAARDQSHGPRDQVRANVPLWRPGAGGRPAALAGPEPRLLRSGSAGVEAQVLQMWPSRAAWAAVDAGGHHRTEEPPVKTCVPGPYGALAGSGVLVHTPQDVWCRRHVLARIRHHQ